MQRKPNILLPYFNNKFFLKRRFIYITNYLFKDASFTIIFLYYSKKVGSKSILPQQPILNEMPFSKAGVWCSHLHFHASVTTFQNVSLGTSTHPWGCDWASGGAMISIRCFNSRTCEGATPAAGGDTRGAWVSIHAPVKVRPYSRYLSRPGN